MSCTEIWVDLLVVEFSIDPTTVGWHQRESKETEIEKWAKETLGYEVKIDWEWGALEGKNPDFFANLFEN